MVSVSRWLRRFTVTRRRQVRNWRLENPKVRLKQECWDGVFYVVDISTIYY
jgi:hypothetical protein